MGVLGNRETRALDHLVNTTGEKKRGGRGKAYYKPTEGEQ